jgi:sodium pump decarboxylase gamma subunit
MTDTAQSMMSMAAQTTAVGMGVVFAALFLLSIYMNIFKRILAHFEDAKRRKAEPETVAGVPAPQVGSSTADPEEETVAVIALGLHLDGFRGGVPADVAAAIMTGTLVPDSSSRYVSCR